MRRIAVVALAVMALAVPGPATADHGSISVLSRMRGGEPFRVTDGSFSCDGRYVAFSTTDLLTSQGQPGYRYIWIYDRKTRALQQVMNHAGTHPQGDSASPSISCDGRYVAFESRAPDMVPGLKRVSYTQTYVFDRVAKRVRLLSRGTDGAGGDGNSEHPRISADGRWVAYRTSDRAMLRGSHGGIVVHDRIRATSSLAVRAPWKEPVAGWILGGPAGISDDGSRILFLHSGRLSSADRNHTVDAYLLHRATGRFELVSRPLQRGTAGDVFDARMSGDGSVVAYIARPEMAGRSWPQYPEQLFVANRRAGTTSLVTSGPDGNAAEMTLGGVSVSGDGRWIAFTGSGHGVRSVESCDAPTPYTSDCRFVAVRYDVRTRGMRRVSESPAGRLPNGDSYAPAALPGGTIAFGSSASNLHRDGSSQGLLYEWRPNGGFHCASGKRPSGPASGRIHDYAVLSAPRQAESPLVNANCEHLVSRDL